LDILSILSISILTLLAVGYENNGCDFIEILFLIFLIFICYKYLLFNEYNENFLILDLSKNI
jgi:hypothetical protein